MAARRVRRLEHDASDSRSRREHSADEDDDRYSVNDRLRRDGDVVGDMAASRLRRLPKVCGARSRRGGEAASENAAAA